MIKEIKVTHKDSSIMIEGLTREKLGSILTVASNAFAEKQAEAGRQLEAFDARGENEIEGGSYYTRDRLVESWEWCWTKYLETSRLLGALRGFGPDRGVDIIERFFQMELARVKAGEEYKTPETLIREMPADILEEITQQIRKI